MRFKIYCKLNDSVISTEYRRGLISFIKSSLIHYNKELFNNYYSKKKDRNFTYSTFFNIDYIKDDLIFLKNKKFNILFSFLDSNEGIKFFNAFNNAKTKNFNFTLFKNSFVIEDIKLEEEKRVQENIINFKTLSPIVIRNNYNKYTTLDDEEGKKFIIEALKKEFKNEDIKILNIKIIRKAVHFYKNVKLLTSIGSFGIEASPSILESIYKNGIGSKRKAGFGMLEIIN